MDYTCHIDLVEVIPMPAGVSHVIVGAYTSSGSPVAVLYVAKPTFFRIRGCNRHKDISSAVACVKDGGHPDSGS